MVSVLITNEDSAIITQKSPIMQRSKLVDNINFIVPKEYNSFLMEEFDTYLEYKMPVSHEIKLVQLTLTDKDYKTDYLQYTLQVDTDITAEEGYVEMRLKFFKTELDIEGNNIQRVRNTDSFMLKIVPISSWFVAPDKELEALAQMILANKNNINAMNEVVAHMNDGKADGIEVDEENLYLTSSGKKIGNSVSLNDLGDKITEATENGTVRMR